MDMSLLLNGYGSALNGHESVIKWI